jgi:asparagine synthase (glutamine-hydrolysing)
MCGIAGVNNYQNYDLLKIASALNHRGPDDQSIYYNKNFALIHTRLAIQDISHGKQPMHYKQFTIIFNGEIYNHLELRKHLSEFKFSTNTDTETLLYLYAKFNHDIFALLDGMYAFVIYDNLKHSLFIARDRSGKKPLYYYTSNNDFAFASELNTIKRLVKLEINENAIYSFLRNGYFDGELTPYKLVQELPAGCYLTVDLNTFNCKINQHFNILDYYEQSKVNLSLQDASDKVESLLIKSINDRLLSSDVEVGAFLSGGIDSNLIVSIAAKINPQLKTFTVKFSGDNDESAYARLTANQYQTNHTEISINITEDLNNDIEKILTNYGEPFADSSAIPSYYVAKAAREHVKVILNGDGADEMFGGYRRYVPFANNWIVYAKYMTWLTRFLPVMNHRSKGDFLSRLLKMATKSGLNLYLCATSDIFEDIHKFPYNSYSSEQDKRILGIFNNNKLSALSKIMYLDYTNILSGALLIKMDIATMANSLEGRSPFLSKYFLEYAPTLPDRFKINKLTTKFILRKLAKKYLDPQLINLPKKGFEVPLISIVDTVLKEKIGDILGGDSYVQKYINSEFLNKILNKQIVMTEAKRAKILWSLFCVEAWYRNDQTITARS